MPLARRKKKPETVAAHPGETFVQITSPSPIVTAVGGVNPGQVVAVPDDIAESMFVSGHAVPAVLATEAGESETDLAADAVEAVKAVAAEVETDTEVARLVELSRAKGATRDKLATERAELETELADLADPQTRRGKLLAEIDGEEPAEPRRTRTQINERLAEIDTAAEDITFQLAEIASREVVARRAAFRKHAQPLHDALTSLRLEHAKATQQASRVKGAAEEIDDALAAYGLGTNLSAEPMVTATSTPSGVRRLSRPEPTTPAAPRPGKQREPYGATA